MPEMERNATCSSTSCFRELSSTRNLRHFFDNLSYANGESVRHWRSRFKDDKLERYVADAMDLCRKGQLQGTGGTAIELDAVVVTGENFDIDDQALEDVVKPHECAI